MRKWIDIVEAALSADLLRKISPYTEEGRKNAEEIQRLQAEIDAEEQIPSSVPAHLRRHDTDTDEWQQELRWLEYDLQNKKQASLERRRAEYQKRQQLWQAKLDGYEQEGREQYNDYMAKVQNFVSKQADKRISALEKQRRTIAQMAKRQLT